VIRWKKLWGFYAEAFLLHQQFERAVTPTARRDLEHAGLDAIGIDNGPHAEALQQPAPGNILGQLLDRDAGLDPPDIRLAQQKAVMGWGERQVSAIRKRYVDEAAIVVAISRRIAGKV